MSLVGENIDAYCLKCKLVLAHIVLFEVGGVVNRVKCKTCGAEHKYRGVKSPAAEKETRARVSKDKKTKTPSRSSSINIAALWEARKADLSPEATVKQYHMQQGYSVRDVIEHPVFGLGFVEQVVSDKRIDVLFQDSLKSLAMNIPS